MDALSDIKNLSLVSAFSVGNVGARGADGAAGAWTMVKKTGDTSRQNNTLSADPDLTFTPAASTKYFFRFRVFFDTTAAADFKFRHTGPASPTLVRIRRCHVVPGGSAYAGVAVDTAFSAADVSVTSTGTTGGYVEIDGIIHNGSNATALAFSWAQNTTDAGNNTTVRAGSYLEYASF